MPASPTERPVGRLLKYHSNFYYVELEGTIYECMVRGLIKKEGTEVLVGDWVELDNLDPANKTARIYQVQPRKNTITRPKMANADQVIVVYSLHEPEFDPNQLDRYLTHIELAGLSAIVAISKCDLAEDHEEIEAIRALYETRLGYPLLCTTVFDRETVAPVEALAHEKITVLAGPSGAGKSSLLNTLNPELKLRVGEVSGKIERGQHTTRHVELVPLHEGDAHTLIADTPGFSNLKFNYVLPREIEQVYRDFEPYRGQCEFSDCLHVDEAGCAVQEHLEEISESRYQSYLALIAEARLYKEESQNTSQKEEYGYKQVSKKGKDAVSILRLKDRDREASRRTQRQEVSLLDAEEDEEDELPEDGADDEPFEPDDF